MPPKKKGLINKKKDKKNEKKKKKQKGVAVDAAKLLREMLKIYEQRCDHYNVAISIPIRRLFRSCIEDSKLLHRFLVDPKDRRKVEFWEDEQLPAIFAPKDPIEEAKAQRRREKKEKKEPTILVKILPLLEALRNKRYIHIQELFVWEVMMEYDDINCLAGMVARAIYQFIRIELVDCFIDKKSLLRLAPTINLCRTLQEICLDFNEFGDEGCKILCEGLKGNRWLLHLSLAYCNLTKVSGYFLGELIAKTPIREVNLDGNELEAEGVILLIDYLTQGAEMEAQERLDLIRLKEEQEAAKKADEQKKYRIDDDDDDEDEGGEKQEESKTEEQPPTPENLPPQPNKPRIPKGKKKKKGKGRKKNKSALPPPPPIGPQINILRLADNGIDQMGRGGNFAPMRCMQLFKTIIAHAKDIEILDLFGNDIGDLGSRQLLEGLMTRRAQKLPQMGVRVGHRINQDTFDLIAKLAPGPKKKKKKGGKKK